MAAVLLDTTVLIDFLRGRPATRRVAVRIEAGDELYVSPVSIEELYRGARERERPAIAQLVEALRLATLTKAAASRAGDWRREHAARGVTLSQADCLVAASAWAVGATLATGSPKDFPMPDVAVEHWPAGA